MANDSSKTAHMGASHSSDDTVLELRDNQEPKSPDKDGSFRESEENAEHDALMSLHGERNNAEPGVKVALEYTVPTTKKLMALSVYIFCNVGLTLYNKAVLGSVS